MNISINTKKLVINIKEKDCSGKIDIEKSIKKTLYNACEKGGLLNKNSPEKDKPNQGH